MDSSSDGQGMSGRGFSRRLRAVGVVSTRRVAREFIYDSLASAVPSVSRSDSCSSFVSQMQSVYPTRSARGEPDIRTGKSLATHFVGLSADRLYERITRTEYCTGDGIHGESDHHDLRRLSGSRVSPVVEDFVLQNVDRCSFVVMSRTCVI